MSKKVLIVGLEPEYNYPGDVKIWQSNNTKYASNHGASLISRTLIKMFDADFAYNIENPAEYLGKYELCIVAFATHATDWRDVSPYADFIEKLNIPTSVFSLGIQDYSPESGVVGTLHHSLKRILDHVVKTTKYIGVRGFHTASLLYKDGYRDVIPIGCPTIFNGMKSNLKIEKKSDFKKPINVFHRTLADLNPLLTKDVTILGQDFLDEVVFTDNFLNDPLRPNELKKYKNQRNGDSTLNNIKNSGVFHKTFEEWYNEIGSSDFVFGPRLHGCISGLIQGIPALMIARDIRVNEIADFYKIPKIKYEDYQSENLVDLYSKIDFSDFNALYPKRYSNFVNFLNKAGIIDYYQGENENNEIEFTFDDLQESRVAILSSIGNLQNRLKILEDRVSGNTLKGKIKKIPLARKLYKKLKG